MARTALFRTLKRLVKSTQKQKLFTPSHNRRQFLKLMGATAVAYPLSGFGSKSFRHFQGMMAQDQVVIVGAGLAGLAAAYSLMKAGVPCELYESSSRIGGRIYTQEGVNEDGMFCELGGELIDHNHFSLLSLAKELGLQIQNLSPYQQKMETMFFYFGGQYYYEDQLAEAIKPLMKAIEQDIIQLYPDGTYEMITYSNISAHNSTHRATQLDQMTLAQYLDQMDGVESWVKAAIGLAYKNEYGLECEEQSALNLLMLIDHDDSDGFQLFGVSDEGLRIKGGNSNLIKKLVAALETGGVTIHRGYKWTNVADRGNNFLLKFERTNDSVKEIQCDRVISAIPFSTLRNVEGISGLNLSAEKMKAIKQQKYATHSKMMFGTQDRYWHRTRGNLRGSNAYIFSDLNAQVFWETSRGQQGKTGLITNFMGGTRGAEYNSSFDLDHIYQFLQVTKGEPSQITKFRSSMNWLRHPHQLGSYCILGPGDYAAFHGSQGEPELGGRLLFAGEHCSVDNSGYMNGAVETGNLAASQILAG